MPPGGGLLVRLLIFPVVFVGSWLPGYSQLAIGQEPSRGGGKAPIHIEVQDGHGTRVAGPVNQAGSAKGAELTFDRAYQPGDRLLFGGPQRMAVHLDDSIADCLIYAPHASSGDLSYEIPYGKEEKETGSAYAPESFAGQSHRIAIRALGCAATTPPSNSFRTPVRTASPGACSTSKHGMRLTGAPRTAITAFGLTSPGDRNCARTSGGSWTSAGPWNWTRFA